MNVKSLRWKRSRFISKTLKVYEYIFILRFLTGNPCTDYEGYREYVIAALPQLKMLDGREIEKSERIKAVQAKQKLEAEQKKKEKEVKKLQEEEGDKTDNKEETKPGFDGRWYTDINDSDKKVDAEKEHQKKVDDFWQEKVPYTPESRLDVHEHLKELKEKDEKKDHEDKPPQRRLFADDGRPFNINESKIDFVLTEEDNSLVLDLAVFRHLDTSLMDCDVQPNYVRVTLKGKVFQLCLTEEVNAERSTAKRSQTTGHLLIIMPK
nr:hypothetical protein BaRGS_023277 [Batillaria attramentaria]